MQVLEAAGGVVERCKAGAPLLQLWDRAPLVVGAGAAVPQDDTAAQDKQAQ